tara:strand:- start:243 stop:536 length:294 start_codon:yes stop_codon:yes gene_type:complete
MAEEKLYDKLYTQMERKGGKEAMKNYKPRRTPGSSDDVVYSGSKQAAMDAAKEAKEAAKNEADYNSSLTTENKAKGGSVSSASKRADGIAIRGKTRA